MRHLSALLGALCLVSGLPAPSAHAAVVFDTIGPTGVTTGGSGVFEIAFAIGFGGLVWLGLVLREPRLLSTILRH